MMMSAAPVTCSSGGLSQEEWARRDRRKLSYHLLGTKNHLPRMTDDEYDDPLFRYLTSAAVPANVLQAKIQFLRSLALSGEDVSDPTVQEALKELCAMYDPSAFDAAKVPDDVDSSNAEPEPQQANTDDKSPRVEGMWISLIKPAFRDDLGKNAKNEYLYSLKRLSFGKFLPGDLVCSLQGTFNPIQLLVEPKERAAAVKNAPKSLKKEVQDTKTPLRTYDIVTAFTIEPGASSADKEDPAYSPSPNDVAEHPIEGLLTTHGYTLPHPDHPNRLSIFFTSGSLEVAVPEDGAAWKQVFHRAARTLTQADVSTATTADNTTNSSNDNSNDNNNKAPHLRSFVALLKPAKKEQKHATTSDAVPIEADGRMSFQLDSPIGGHDHYVDILYLDDTLRILRGSHDDFHVGARVPNSDVEYH